MNQSERAAPRLTALRPGGWHTAESLSLIAPGGFPNVVVSSAPIPPGGSVESDEEEGESLRRDLPGYSEHSLGATTFLGSPATIRHYEWVARGGLRVAQLQIRLVAEGHEHTATATCLVETFARDEAVVRQVLDSVDWRAVAEAPAP